MTNNIEYITYQVCNNQKIYIDTCSLMDTERLLNFIDNAEEIFLKHNKQIIIHSSIMAELVNFTFSSNYGKRAKSEKALTIIKNYPELFCVEEITDEDMASCFADPKLLALLIINKDKYRQLLISNDSNLTSDAFNFNNIKSIHGNRINVCYLGNMGSMYISDCAKKNLHDKDKNHKQSIVMEQESIQNNDKNSMLTEGNSADEVTISNVSNNSFDLKSFTLGSLLTGSSITIIYNIYKIYKKKALN